MVPPDLTAIEQALARENPHSARAALVTLLESQPDLQSALTLRILAQSPFAPDALAATLDRLVALLRTQEAQIHALEALIEPRL